jgi:hypothetical protein
MRLRDGLDDVTEVLAQEAPGPVRVEQQPTEDSKLSYTPCETRVPPQLEDLGRIQEGRDEAVLGAVRVAEPILARRKLSKLLDERLQLLRGEPSPLRERGNGFEPNGVNGASYQVVDEDALGILDATAEPDDLQILGE